LAFNFAVAEVNLCIWTWAQEEVFLEDFSSGFSFTWLTLTLSSFCADCKVYVAGVGDQLCGRWLSSLLSLKFGFASDLGSRGVFLKDFSSRSLSWLTPHPFVWFVSDFKGNVAGVGEHLGWGGISTLLLWKVNTTSQPGVSRH
jgi:hypothetical protein